MAGPLEGFRIIDVCRAGPGQLATGLLADYGADVVTIVEPGHAERRAAGGEVAESAGINRRNKRSLALNLRAPGALEVFFKLAHEADGLLESNRPGAVKRLGIDYSAIRSVNPGIVYCSLSGFGQKSPYSAIAAHDLSYQGIAGMLALDKTDVPQFPPYNQADMNASWFGAMALLMGLLGKSKIGEGQYIDVAFTDVAVTIPPGRMADLGLQGHDPTYHVYETADGRYVTLSTREPWFVERLCRLVGREDWIGPGRTEGPLREEMFAFFRRYFLEKTLAEWTEILAENDIQFGPVNRTVDEMRSDPHLQSRDMVLEVQDPRTGAPRYEPGFALKFADTPAGLRWGPSIMGSDTNAILGELGYGEKEIDALRQASVVG